MKKIGLVVCDLHLGGLFKFYGVNISVDYSYFESFVEATHILIENILKSEA